MGTSDSTFQERHVTHCRHCDRTVALVAPKGLNVQWLRCRSCSTPLPVEQAPKKA